MANQYKKVWKRGNKTATKNWLLFLECLLLNLRTVKDL